MNKPRPQGWLEKPRTVNALVYGLWLLCAISLAAEFFYTKHPHFGFAGWFGFYAFFGFVAYCTIVLSAKQLRRVVRRDENYYADGKGLSPGPGDEADTLTGEKHPPHD